VLYMPSIPKVGNFDEHFDQSKKSFRLYCIRLFLVYSKFPMHEFATNNVAYNRQNFTLSLSPIRPPGWPKLI